MKAIQYLAFAILLGIGSTRNFDGMLGDLMYYGSLILVILAIMEAPKATPQDAEEEE